MKLFIDAQLPRRMVKWFGSFGCDAVHVLDAPNGNRSTDSEISQLADSENRIVVTKDSDFVDSHILHGRPKRLLLISTGNISNQELERLLLSLLPEITREFQAHAFLEIGRGGITIRG